MHLGVSATTVSRALNNQGRISQKIRDKVKLAASDLNYKPSLVARSLIKQKTNTLGVIVPMIGNTAFSKIVRGVEEVAYEQGYNIILCNSGLDSEREYSNLEMLSQRQVEGIAIVPFCSRTHKNTCLLEEIQDSGIKVVIMEQDIEVPQFNRVVAANRDDACKLVKYLINCGYSRIGLAHLGLAEWNISEKERAKGYMQALEQAGIEYDSNLVIQAGNTSIAEEESIYLDKLKGFFRSSNHIEAVFATSDMLAIKIIYLLNQLGIKVPDDVAVVGFDGILLSEYLTVPLSTVKQPAMQIGKRSAEILFDNIKNSKQNFKPVHECIHGELSINGLTHNKALQKF